jgi:hypothetical protein
MNRIDNDPDTQINPNKIMWWLLCTVTAVLMGCAAVWAAGVQNGQKEMRDKVDAITHQQETLDERLSTIEGKLDILLQRAEHR